MLVSSGMRIGEAIQLQKDDIELVKDEDLDKKPTTIHIRGEYTKSRNKRIAFMSREATEAMRGWLDIREASLKTAIARSRGRKNKEDNRIFPFEIGNMYAVWNGALDKAKLNGVDKTTNRRKMHPHVLRKFFRSKMTTVIPLDIVETLMGHEGYLTTVYRKHSQEQLAEFYMRAEHTVLIFAETGDVTKLKKEMEESHDKLVDTITGLNTDKRELKNRVTELEDKMDKLADELHAALENLRITEQIADDALRGDEDILQARSEEIEELKARVEELEKKQKKK
jgi:methyl-accepting chemotaxis protein